MKKVLVSFLALSLMLSSLIFIAPQKAYAARTITCSTTAQIHDALKNAMAGDTIIIKAGTYTGSTSTSGNTSAFFYSGKNGTSSARITLKGEDPANPPILTGTGYTSGYTFYLKGDYWTISDIKFKTAKNGIMLDNANYNNLYKLEVYNIGYAGIHLRDGSSNNIVDSCNVHHTGKYSADYGEGVYVGSDYLKWTDNGGSYIKECDNNTIKNTHFGPYIYAEPIDIKEGTTGTIVENNTFDATGIKGTNGGDSFIDAKGNNAIIRNNVGYQNGATYLYDAFQVHQKFTGWGLNNNFYGNTVYFDSGNTTSYMVNAPSGSAKASNNTRSPSGNMYTGNVTEY